MKYKHFKSNQDLFAVTHLLMHTIRVYDLAGALATEAKDFDRLVTVGDKLSELSDKLIVLALQTQEEENNDRANPSGNYL